MRRKYLRVTWVEVGVGIRFLVAKVMRGKGPKPKKIIYPAEGEPCTEPRFLMYVAGRNDELRIRIPVESKRRMRRFLRDYVCSVGGSPWSTNYWFTPWR